MNLSPEALRTTLEALETMRRAQADLAHEALQNIQVAGDGLAWALGRPIPGERAEAARATLDRFKSDLTAADSREKDCRNALMELNR